MPNFFFNVRYEHQASPIEGEELPDKDAAWQAATIRAENLLKQLGGNLKPGDEWELEVTDELKNRVYLISINSHEFASGNAICGDRRLPDRPAGRTEAALLRRENYRGEAEYEEYDHNWRIENCGGAEPQEARMNAFLVGTPYPIQESREGQHRDPGPQVPLSAPIEKIGQP
jgi:hypothetical protein